MGCCSFFLFVFANKQSGTKTCCLQWSVSMKCDVHIPSWQCNHVWKKYYTIASNNGLIEKDLLYSEIGIANRSIMIENISHDNLKNTTRKIKLTKTRAENVSIWLLTFERIEIKISAVRRFVSRQLVIPVDSSKFKIQFIFIAQQFTLPRWPCVTTCSWNKPQQFCMNRCTDRASFKRWLGD
jgi:hypothetical protein